MRGRSGSVFLLVSGVSLASYAADGIRCEPLDPGVKVSNDKEARIAVSVDGIFEAAKSG